MAILTFRAADNTMPSRFVSLVSGGTNSAAESSDNAEIIGVSQEGTRSFPQQSVMGELAATTDETFACYSVGEVCLVVAGAAFNVGTLLKSDSDGRAVPIATTGTTIQNYGAVALEQATAAGQKIRCLVVPFGKVRPALS